MSRSILVVVAFMGICGSWAAADALPAASSIEEVTVYRGQALVTRTVKLPAEAGELELVVADLPAQIIGSSTSASAEGAAGVTIRSVRFRTRAVSEAPKKAIAELDEQIKQVNRKVYANAQAEALLRSKRAHLDKLESFTSSTASAELSKGVLNVETLSKVSEYIFKRREALLPEQIKIHEAAQDLGEQLSLLQRKRKELAGSGSKSVREAVLFVSKADKSPAAIRLSYLVNGAQWSPAYNLRMADGGKKIAVEYLAQIRQTTGEDWSKVKLTLSTATPAMNAESPLLAPFWVSLAGQTKETKQAIAQQIASNSDSQYGYLNTWQTLPTQTEGAAFGLNVAAAGNQVLELNEKVSSVRALGETVRAMIEGLAVSYPMPGTMSLPSRSDQQLVQIASTDLAARSYYVATPLLSPYVWRHANVVNTGKVPMLAGPYSAYIGGEFVGRGRMPLVACGQEVTVGFGVDTELRCHRELKDKSDRVSWGSKVQTFQYELRLESFKKAPVVVRLIDRIPATKGDDVQIELTKTSQPLCTDAVYARDYRPKGILRWDIDLEAESTGVKVRRIEYGFDMKYAKDAHIGREAAAMPSVMQEDLEREMMKAAY